MNRRLYIEISSLQILWSSRMDWLGFVILGQLCNAPKERIMRFKDLPNGTSAQKCSMDIGNITIRLMYGALAASWWKSPQENHFSMVKVKSSNWLWFRDFSEIPVKSIGNQWLRCQITTRSHLKLRALSLKNKS